MFIVTKKIDGENISKVCRTCLREDNDKMICLFIGPAESSLAAKLSSLSCLEVSQGDGLPEKMCDRCVMKAESALLFREQCRAADQALRQAALEVSKLKAYQQSQNVIPLQYSQDVPSLANYQDFYVHNHFHPPFYQREETIPRHMHIVEPHNTYFNLNQYNVETVNHELMPNTDATDNRASCALQCSLCNYDNTQFINQALVDPDISSDEINIEVEDNSNIDYERPINQSIEHSIADILGDSNCDNEKEILTSEIVKNNRFKCETCSRLFNEESALMDHKSIHNRIKPFECYHCGKSYSSKSKLAAHARLHTRTNIHQCSICQKIFSYPSYLNEHMKTHNSKPIEKKVSFECIPCKKQFSLAKSYKRHMKFHTGKDLFHCDICDKLFTQKYLLKVHMRYHQQTKLHKCNLCDKMFNQKSNLVEHTRTHTKVKPFKCTVCDKTFAQSSHLKTHELSHNSVRKFQCRICGKRFKLSSHLKRHVNLHTGLKIYKCDQCDQTFSQQFSLKRHAKKHAELSS